MITLCSMDDVDPEQVGIFDLTLLRPGLWHLHGNRQTFVTPHSRMREAFAEAEEVSLGVKTLIVRLHNKWDGEKGR